MVHQHDGHVAVSGKRLEFAEVESSLGVGYVRYVDEGLQWVDDAEPDGERLLLNISDHVIERKGLVRDTKTVQVRAGRLAARLGKALDKALAVVDQDCSLSLGIDEQARREWNAFGEASGQVRSNQRLAALLWAREDGHVPESNQPGDRPFHGAVHDGGRRSKRRWPRVGYPSGIRRQVVETIEGGHD